MIGAIGSRCPFPLSDHAARVHHALLLLHAGEVVYSEKEDCGTKACAWPRSGKDGKTKNGTKKQNPDGSSQPEEDGGQSSHDTWKNSQPHGKWKVNNEYDSGNPFLSRY